MKKRAFILLILTGCFLSAAKKDKQISELPNIEARMEKADKITAYRAKKDVAWHKTEYNKVLKYLNKSRKQEVR